MLSTLVIIIFLFFMIFLIVLQGFYLIKLNKDNKQIIIIKDTPDNLNKESNITDNNSTDNNEYKNDIIKNDVISNYDKKMLYDPFIKQYDRPSSYVIGNPKIWKYINIPTRGLPDTFHIIGTLTSSNDNDPDNKILQLFGRQKYIGGNSPWEYYTIISSGNNNIKINIGEMNELYDGDNVYIKELTSDYTLNKYPNDIMQYNPYII